MDGAVRAHLARRTLHMRVLAGAVALDALIDGPGAGVSGWVAFGTLVPVIAVALALPGERGGLARFAAAAAALVAFAMPPAAGGLDWPRLLPLAAAGMVLEADRGLRTAIAFSPEGEGREAPAGGSLGAAFALALAGDALVHAFVAAVGAGAGPTTPAGFLAAALAGGTVVHRALVVLFLAELALIVFAAVDHLRERLVWRALAARLGPREDPATREAALARHADSLTAARVRTSLGRADGAPDLSALLALRAEGHRTMRALIAFLPLLGFIGTVIGLATAIAALRDAGGGAAGTAAIAASLSGLAVKFETTLLGLGGALAATALLVLLERAEAGLDVAVDRRLARRAAGLDP